MRFSCGASYCARRRQLQVRLGTSSRAWFTLFGLGRYTPRRVKATPAGRHRGSVQRNAISEHSNHQNRKYQQLAGCSRRKPSHGGIPSRPRRQLRLNLRKAAHETGTVKYQQADPSHKQDSANPPRESRRRATNKGSSPPSAIAQFHSRCRESPC